MQLLSKEMESELVNNLMAQCIERMEQLVNKPPYIKQKDLLAELNVDYQYLKRLEAAGLKRFKLDPKDKTAFYKRSAVYDLMDRLAE